MAEDRRISMEDNEGNRHLLLTKVENDEGAQEQVDAGVQAAKQYTDQQVTTRAPLNHSHGADDLPSASTAAKGIVQLTDSRTSASQVLALTAKAMNDHRGSGDHDGRYFRRD